MGVPGFSFAQRGEKCLTQATRSARSCLVKVLHCGMLERSKPRAMVSKRSWSVGKVPVGVERHLNMPNWKSRGLGYMGAPAKGRFRHFHRPVRHGNRRNSGGRSAVASLAWPVIFPMWLSVPMRVSQVILGELRPGRQRERQNRSCAQ